MQYCFAICKLILFSDRTFGLTHDANGTFVVDVF